MRSIVVLILACFAVGIRPATAQSDLNDLEMAHVAVVASNIDIAYAHLALAFSENPDIRSFAETMIRDHEAVNAQVVALAKRLNVTAQDNPLSQALLAESRDVKDAMSKLRGKAFDQYYARNELAFHEKVNGVVADAFIPNVENADVKAAFEGALTIFRGHETHARDLAAEFAEAGR